MPRGAVLLRALWLIFPLALIPAAASADCRNGSFPDSSKTFSLARVLHAPRAYFHTDMAPCPDETPACQNGTYVVPGDTVLTRESKGDYICAFFPNRVGGSAGHIKSDELSAIPQPRAAPLAAWADTWVNDDDTLTLKVQDGKLAVDGEAFWPSRNPPRDVIQAAPTLAL